MMGEFTQPMLLALGALVCGGIGSAWIARHRRGMPAALSYLILTAVPYLATILIIVALTDKSLNPQQRQYDVEMVFAIFVIAFTVPWIVACLLGRWLGRRFERLSRAGSLMPRAPETHSSASASVSTKPSTSSPVNALSGDLPDWRHADYPRLTLVQLDAQSQAMALRFGFAAQRLPECRGPRDGEGPFIGVEKFDYLYGFYERGQLSVSHLSANADEICYRIFYDLAIADAMNLRSKNPDPTLNYLVQVHNELDAILYRIDPRWAAQAAHERALRGRNE